MFLYFSLADLENWCMIYAITKVPMNVPSENPNAENQADMKAQGLDLSLCFFVKLPDFVNIPGLSIAKTRNRYNIIYNGENGVFIPVFFHDSTHLR